MSPSSKNISSDKAKLHREREERSLTPCAHCFQLCCSPNLRLISTGLGLARWYCCKLYFSFRSHSPGHGVCLASNGKSHTFQHGCVCVISYSVHACMHVIIHTYPSAPPCPQFWCAKFYKARAHRCVICALRSTNSLCFYPIKNERPI